ncbi:lipocalin family protein [Flavobacterium sp.]|jgi:hypothetical protein|uniref:lipocalin family protein n=1 Tax=Flavobacterium sp. TaxID=239 RepID=UPI0037BE3B58
MKNVLKSIFLFIAIIALNSCSKEDDNLREITPTLVGKWEFSKYVNYNAQNQEELTDYNHQCTTIKDFIQFDANGIMSDSYSHSNCQAETGIYTYIIENDVVRFYNGNTLAPYFLKILSLTSSQVKVQWIRNTVARAGVDTYILTRK